jgi:hypothetical protein
VNAVVSHQKAMRYLILFVLVLLLVPICYAEEEAPLGLSAYIDRNLWKLDEAGVEKFWLDFRLLTGDAPEETKPFESLEAWAVSRFRSGNAEWAFIEAYRGYNVPDVSAVRVHVFDKEWKRLARHSFPTGYRFFLNQATVRKDDALQQDLLVVKVTSTGPFLVLPNGEQKPAFEQGDFQRQYYAFLDDRMALIRLEDNNEKLVRNNYCWSTPMKGGEIPKRSSDQWIMSLASDSVAQQLATLVWLSGTHLKSTEQRYQNVNQESIEDSSLFESLQNNDTVRKTLTELQNSEVKWVNEYAKLAIDSRNK